MKPKHDPSQPLANRRREAFCQALVSVPPPSQAEAARRAGYSHRTADRIAHVMLSFVDVSSRVAWLREDFYKRQGMTRSEMIAILAKQARASLGDFLGADGCVDLEKVRNGGQAVASLERVPGEFGCTVKFKIASQRDAIETIAKISGILKEPATSVTVAMDHVINIRDLRAHGETDADASGGKQEPG